MSEQDTPQAEKDASKAKKDKPPVSYNEAARYAVKKLYPQGFLKFLVPEAFKCWELDGWVDSQMVSFPGDPERRCDTVFRFQRIDGLRRPVAFALEFEREPSSDMYPREGEYILRVHRDVPFDRESGVDYDVVGGIVFLTGPAQPKVWRLAPDDFAGLGMTVTLAVPCFREMDALATFERIRNNELTPALLVFGPLFGNSDTEEVAKACLELIRNHAAIHLRKDMLAIADVMSGLNAKPEVWRAVFKEFDMDRDVSPLLLEVYTKGLSKAETETRQVMFEDLEERFMAKVPADIRQAIEGQKDQRTLARWLGRLMGCADWDAVRQLVGLSTGS